MMFDINGWEFVIILVVAAFIIGPERLPVYAAKLRSWVRQLRALADSAKGQLRDQIGPEFDEVDWRQFDPRQYDPRRIVREALLEGDTAGDDDLSTGGPSSRSHTQGPVPKPISRVSQHDPARPTPWDGDAT